jgi:integrase
VLRRLFAWAREERIIPVNPALELRTGWGGSVRRRVIIPSIPQVLRLAQALDMFKPSLGDVAMVLAFTGLRWEEAVAVPIGNVSLDGQCMRIDRTASESGGRRDVREDLKTRAAERTVMILDIAMPAVRRLAERGAAGRERSDGKLYGRLINGERGGYLGYGMWRRYLKLAQGYTAAHPDGIVSYTAHELRHVCASLLIASRGLGRAGSPTRWDTARSRPPRTSTDTCSPRTVPSSWTPLTRRSADYTRTKTRSRGRTMAPMQLRDWRKSRPLALLTVGSGAWCF